MSCFNLNKFLSIDTLSAIESIEQVKIFFLLFDFQELIEQKKSTLLKM